jgi:glyoxylase-like metal-dependent hydrolase (beta-lactamase superfamily II)
MRLSAASLLVGVLLAAPAASAPLNPRSDCIGCLMPPEKIAPHIWVMRQPDRLWAAVIGNVEIIEQSDGVVLMDSGGTIADGREVVRAVRRLTQKPIKAVGISHWHNDHPLGIPGILESFPNARVIATPATAEYMKTELKTGVGKADPALDGARRKTAADNVKALTEESKKASNPPAMRRQYAIEAKWIAQRVKRQMGNYVVLPTETVADRLLIDDPVAPVEFRFLGVGNTHGDMIGWMPRQRVVATGDIVVAPTPYGFTVSTKTWLPTLRKLEALPFTTAIPGHGKVQRDRKYLATLQWSMRDIVAHARAAAKSGKTKEQGFAAFDQKAEQARFGARDAWTKKWLSDYWLQGMFETAYDEAKGIAAPGK